MIINTPSPAAGMASGLAGAEAPVVPADLGAGNLGSHTIAATPPSPPRGQSAQTGALLDANGAPALAAPETSYSADFLSALLQYLSTNSEHAQLDAQKGSIQTNSIKAQETRQAQQEKLEKWIKQCEAAAKTGGIAKIFGWIGKGLALLASAVAMLGASIATGGVAGPLMAVAAVGMVTAVMGLASGLSQELGGPELSFSNGFSWLTSKCLMACGVSEETAEKIGRVAAGVMPMLISAGALYILEPQLLATTTTGILQLANASEEVTQWVSLAVGVTAAVGVALFMAKLPTGPGDALAKLQPMLTQKVQGFMKVGVSATQGLTGAAEGGLKIKQAGEQKGADDALADKHELDAYIARLTQLMEENREEIKKLVEQMQDAVLMVSKMFQDSSETSSLINSNLSRVNV